MKTLIWAFGMVLCGAVNAEVYKWTDSSGKVHYSDKKMMKSAADITDQVKHTNLDSSSGEQRKLEAIFRKENEADREYKRRQSQLDPELTVRCKEARDYLAKIDGRVQFVDQQGKPVMVTENERKEKVIQMQRAIREHCPH